MVGESGDKIVKRNLADNCSPGRFFAASEIKLLLAIIALNYEIEPLKEEPTQSVFSTDSMPDLNAKLRIRRRKV